MGSLIHRQVPHREGGGGSGARRRFWRAILFAHFLCSLDADVAGRCTATGGSFGSETLLLRFEITRSRARASFTEMHVQAAKQVNTMDQITQTPTNMATCLGRCIAKDAKTVVVRNTLASRDDDIRLRPSPAHKATLTYNSDSFIHLPPTSLFGSLALTYVPDLPPVFISSCMSLITMRRETACSRQNLICQRYTAPVCGITGSAASRTSHAVSCSRDLNCMTHHLAHVVDGQCSCRGRCQRLHLHTWRQRSGVGTASFEEAWDV